MKTISFFEGFQCLNLVVYGALSRPINNSNYDPPLILHETIKNIDSSSLSKAALSLDDTLDGTHSSLIFTTNIPALTPGADFQFNDQLGCFRQPHCIPRQDWGTFPGRFGLVGWDSDGCGDVR